VTNRPIVARVGLTGLHRSNPYAARWSAIDLARRRALALARTQAETAEDRGDPPSTVAAWQLVVHELERIVRRAEGDDV
jgi:hypothetical protein